jgi:hypothetical protein
MEQKKFIIKLVVVGLFALLLHAAMIPLVDGTTLIYFHKCSSEKQESLIIGTSRASQAIMPSVIKDSLGIDMFNFAFNGTTSPYGQVYTRAIEEKLKANTTEGTFIVCVDPWSLRIMKDSITGEEELPEEKNILNKLHWFNGYPNVEFILKDYNQGWGNIAYTQWRKNSSVYGHEDGWIEVTRDINADDIAKRTIGKANGFRNSLRDSEIAQYRINEMKLLIEKLSNKGDVFLVRLPVSEAIFEIEEEFYPAFDSLITSLSATYNAPYFSMQPLHDEVVFNDGHHINRSYAPTCTAMITSWIKQHKKGLTN